MTNFIQAYALNPQTANDIDDEIEAWHSQAYDEDSKLELHAFLGMTADQYGRWLKDPSCLDTIAAEHVAANSLMAKMLRGEATEADLAPSLAQHAASGSTLPVHSFLGLEQDEHAALEAGTTSLTAIRNKRLRAEALRTAFDVLTAYMTDACPDNENWEDFDGDVDAIRMQIDEALTN